jgi:hypothetical protein
MAPYRAPSAEPMNQSLQIIQYNVNRSREIVMADFLRRKEVIKADIIALREPWRNPFNDDTHHPAKTTHYMLYPPSAGEGRYGGYHEGGRPRTGLLIR